MISLLERKTTRPGMPVTAKRSTFMRLFAHRPPSTGRLSAVTRLSASTAIAHHAADTNVYQVRVAAAGGEGDRELAAEHVIVIRVTDFSLGPVADGNEEISREEDIEAIRDYLSLLTDRDDVLQAMRAYLS